MFKNKFSKFLFLCTTLFTSFLLSNEVFAKSPLINRLSGINRYETNISIVKNGWSESSNVVLANGQDYPDALCAAPLANAKNAPIILTAKDHINTSAINELSRLKTKNVYIIGGTGVVSSEIEEKLKSLGINCIRLAGKNRYETSVRIAEQIGTSNGIVVASGENFPDALSIAPIAAKKACLFYYLLKILYHKK
ncbi:cell wall-binding repeat-containing protein [Haloimpatiens sp. FM7330]|uniref:cell wall-binding repeat-containing protein n=1 Tax=Haloimpatiens sp. FM7330 TaxID=3298610 RepID=UPI0036299064